VNRSLWTSIACLAFLLFAGAGCGGDDDDETESASQQGSIATTETATSPKTEEAEEREGSRGADRTKETPGETTDDAGRAADGDSGGARDGDSGRVGDGDSGDTGGPGATQPEVVQGDGDEPPGETGDKWPPKDLVTVTIRDSKYIPQRVVVPKDGWIMWVNEEARTNHTATKTRGPSYAPNSPTIGWGGDTYTDVFTARGEIEYICTNHPLRMKGFITVE